MKTYLISVTLLASLASLSGGEAHAQCNPAAVISQEFNTSLTFSRVADAIPYRPFSIEDANGNPLPKDTTALLSLPEAEKQRRLDEMKNLEKSLATDGFDLSSTLCDTSFADRRMSVGDYEKEINDAEKKLNALGQTLRITDRISILEKQVFDTAKIEKEVAEGVQVYTGKAQELYDETIGKVEAKYDEIKKKYEDYSQKAKDLKLEDLYVEGERHKCEPKSGGSFSTENSECFLNEVEDPVIAPVDPLADPNVNDCKADTPFGKAYLLNESWTDAGGDKNFGWNGKAKFSLQTDARGMLMNADAKIDGLVMDKTVKIVKGEANFVSPRTGKASGKIALEFAGNKVLNETAEWDLSLVDSRDKDGKERYMVHKEQRLFSTTIPIGFVPVLLMVDSKVSAGPSYGLNLAPVKIWGKAEWVQNASLIASAGLGADLKVFVVLAGVKGSIELVNFTLGVYPEAGFYLDERQRPVFNARMWSGSKMRTLAGSLNLGVWAKTTFAVPQSKSSFPFVEMKPLTYEWSKQLGSYPGYDFPQAVLFDKEVGYDVCTGRKTVKTYVESEPRQIDQRESLEIKELLRVEKLEAALISKLDEALFSDKVLAIKRDLNKELSEVQRLKQLRSEATVTVLGNTLNN